MSIPTLNSFYSTFNSKLEPDMRHHLKNVYACLSMSTMMAAAGVYVHLYMKLFQPGLLSVIAAIGFLFVLLANKYNGKNGKNRKMRLGYLLGFAFFSGMGIGPLMEMAIDIVVTALVSTALIFISFSIVSLTAECGRWLFLGGSLTGILVLSLANIFFFGSQLIFKILGLLIICGFVLYDTQLIIEKRRAGDRDFVAHSVDLFVDLIGIFRRIVIILSKKERRPKRRNSN